MKKQRLGDDVLVHRDGGRGNEAQQLRASLDRMAQQVHNLFKFKIFYDQMDFSVDQHLAIKLTDSSGTRLCLEKATWRESIRWQLYSVL